jgi:gliding motility-associated-like protein
MRKLLLFFFILGGLYAQSQSICGGSTIILSAPNPSNLAGPSYSLNPGGAQGGGNPNFTVSPNTTTTYTLYTTGGTPVQTTTFVTTVVVNPQPNIAPTFTQPSCADTTACFNLNLTWSPNTVPSYTIDWEAQNQPDCITSPTQFSCCGLSSGVKNATITTDAGCSVVVNFTITPKVAPASFSFVPLGPTFSITCINPTVYVTVSNTVSNTYTWNSLATGPVPSLNEVVLTNTNTGTWTVSATNTLSGCSITRTFVVGSNTTAPISAISPTFQNLTCTTTATTVTLTAVTPTVNFTHFIYSQQGGTLVANTATAPYSPPPGTHTHVLLDNINGCVTIKQFTVATSPGFPTFTLTSTPPGFTVGCSSKSVTTINFAGAQSDPPGDGLTFTILAVGHPTNYSTGSTQTYSISTAGTYTAIAKGNSNSCETKIPFSIIQNTFAPKFDTVSVPRNILDCFVPQTVLEAYSSTDNIKYEWTWPGTPGSFLGSTLTVDAKTATPSATLINNYTITITDNNNLCKVSRIVPMYQSLFKPKAKITSGGTNSLTCVSPTIMLTNASESGVPVNSPPIPPPSKIIRGLYWTGPSPQPPDSIKSTYVAGIVGEYTMVAQDMNNGCTSTTTIPIFDNRIFPTVNNPVIPPPSVLDCGASSASIAPIVSSATAGLTYSWKLPTNPTPTTSPTGALTLSTNLIGIYTVVVTNSINACATTVTMAVVNGSLNGSIAVDKSFGYVPLQVNFTNNSTSSLGTASIVSLWSFGNGSTLTAKATSVSPQVTYNQPGTYSVTVFLAKGSCIDSVSKVIKVELPSKVEVPNVFTPDGDGVNDVYFLRANTLSEIEFKIVDRWGRIVYEVISKEGNVSWDGKNQYGVDSAAGTYFYILNAKGKDGVAHEQKGTITLIR